MRRVALATAIAAVVLFFVGTPAAHADTDCKDYPSQKAAQDHLRANPSDPDHLDGDNDGVACETYPYPSGSQRDEVPVGQAANQQSGGTTVSTAAPTVLAASSDGSVVATEAAPVRTATVAHTTTRRTSATVANTGPNDYLWFVAAFGLLVLGAGSRMRGRRTAGAHWL